MKYEVRVLSRGLYEDVAVAEHAWDDAVYLARDILYGTETEFADSAREQVFLLDVHDPFVRYDPDIEEDIYPDKEDRKPEEEQERIFEKDERDRIPTAHDVRIEERKDDESSEKRYGEDERQEEMGKDVEPVPMVDGDDPFRVVFSGKPDIGEFLHGFSIRKYGRVSGWCPDASDDRVPIYPKEYDRVREQKNRENGHEDERRRYRPGS